jgi:hypothetical protein
VGAVQHLQHHLRLLSLENVLRPLDLDQSIAELAVIDSTHFNQALEHPEHAVGKADTAIAGCGGAHGPHFASQV